MAYFPASLTPLLIQADGSFDFLTLFRNVINGLTFGSIYALMALGIVLIYKASDVVNFGQGQMAMFCTFVCFSLFEALLPSRLVGQPLPDSIPVGSFGLALLGTLVFAGVMGVGIERGLLRPLQNAPVLSQVMVTIGLGVLLYGLASFIWKADLKKFPQVEFFDGPALLTFGSGPNTIVIGREVAAASAVGLVVSVILFLFFNFSLPGKAIRAMASDRHTARLLGVNVDTLTGLVWIVALILAAIAGILAAPKISLSPTLMDDIALKAFAAAVLGGLTSLPGAILGGVLLGVISNLLDYYLPGYSQIAACLLIVAILTLRPNGLLGQTLPTKV